MNYYFVQDSGISGLLEHVNLNLLQAGLQIQKNYMKTNSNWNENYALTQVQHLFKVKVLEKWDVDHSFF